jgi:hypothetical protein
VPTISQFKDIQYSLKKLDKTLKYQRILSFYVQRRIVEAMFPWGHFWGHSF